MPLRGGVDLMAALRSNRATRATLRAALPVRRRSPRHLAGPSSERDRLKPIRAYRLAKLIEKAMLTGPTRRTSRAGGDNLRHVRGSRILLVEDHPVNQRVALRLLQKLAADVVLANTAPRPWSASRRRDRCGIDGLPDAGHGRLHRPPGCASGNDKRVWASDCPSLRSPPTCSRGSRTLHRAGMDAHIANPSCRRNWRLLSRYLGDKRARLDVDVKACTRSPAAIPSSSAS